MRQFLLIAAAGCAGTEQAAAVELPVATTSTPVASATTDLGYTVQLDRLRVAVAGIQFTIEGEQHKRTSVAPHPGHSAGGEVTGELAVSDPDTVDSESLLGRIVTLQVAQLRPQ